MAVDDDSSQQFHCSNCEAELRYADYVLGMQQGVIGGSGFVPTHLHDWILFCGEECAAEYFSGSVHEPTWRSKPRIP